MTADALVLTVILLFVAGLVTVNVLKGKAWFAAVGLVVHVVWYVGAIRLAKPDSWWARRYYHGDKLYRSQLRFGATPPAPPEPAWLVTPPESAPECSGSAEHPHVPVRCIPVSGRDEPTYRCSSCGREQRVTAPEPAHLTPVGA